MSTRQPLRTGEVVRIRGQRWRVLRQSVSGDAAVLDVAGGETGNRGERARFVLPFEPVDRLAASSVPKWITPGRWRHVAREALVEANPSWASLRAAARAAVMVIPFQLEPVLALTRGEACRFLIADAVGLGKTIQAGLILAEALERRPEGRALVVAPAGLRDQWHAELRKRFQLEAAILDAPGIARLSAVLPADLNPWAVQRIAITSVDYVKRPEVLRSLEPLTWDVVVFDEAHNLAGRSDRSAAATLLGQRARVLVMLTATPHSGDEDAFERLCALGRLGDTDPLLIFRRSRVDAAVARARRASLLRIRPTAAERVMHEALAAYARLVWREASRRPGARLAMSVLSRRACSSAASLARSLERRLALLGSSTDREVFQGSLPLGEAGPDDEPDALLGAPGLGDASDEVRRLERLLDLARAAAPLESKMTAIRRLVSRSHEPAIVFTEYRDTLLRLAAVMSDFDTVLLHGGLTPRERAGAVRRFTEGDARLLLATDAGSEGLNLHHRCRLVVNLEVPWTPLRLEQRAGRVDRIGQARRVHVVHLVAAGTCEEFTLARLVVRIHRLHGALSLFGAGVDEQRIADAVLGHGPLPDLSEPPAAVRPDIMTTDLCREARDEAARLELSRRMETARGEAAPEAGRPVIARVRRHGRRRSMPQGLWLFRVSFVDRCGRVVADGLLPFRAELARLDSRTPSFTRLLLDPGHERLQLLLNSTCEKRIADLQLSLLEPLRRWTAREHGIAEMLRARHARLAAGLLQRSLFDRREERRVLAEAAVLDHAMGESQLRLAELAAAAEPRADTCDLVFGVVLE